MVARKYKHSAIQHSAIQDRAAQHSAANQHCAYEGSAVQVGAPLSKLRAAIFVSLTVSLTFAMVALVSPVSVGAQSGNAARVSAAVTCVDYDGQVTVSIVNNGQALRRYRVLVADLPERGVNIGGGVTGTVRIGGLVDGAVSVAVLQNGGEVWSGVVTVACDPPLSATVTVSCFDGRGRFDFVLNNGSNTAAKFVVVIPGLPDRARAVAANSTRTLTVTGRNNGEYQLAVIADGRVVFNKSATVGCDASTSGAPISAGPEVRVTVGCLDQRGLIEVSLYNPGPTTRTYTVGVGSVPPRTKSLSPGAATQVRVTGRPEGAIVVSVDGVSTASGLFLQTVIVSCDQQVNPPSNGSLEPPAIEADGVGARVRCIAGNGAIDVAVRNGASIPRTAAVLVPGLPERSQVVPAGGTSLFTFTGRADDLYEVVVTVPSGEVVTRSLVVFCDSAELAGLTFDWINEYRARNGVASVLRNAALDVEAEVWSGEMMRNGVLEHDLCCVGDRLPAYFATWAELVGRVETRLADLQMAFEDSPGHASALRDPQYDEVGIGFASDGIALWVTIYLGGT